MKKIRFSQCQVGTIFKYYGALYVKTRMTINNRANYEPNCERLDNHKPSKIHGSWLVEVDQ